MLTIFQGKEIIAVIIGSILTMGGALVAFIISKISTYKEVKKIKKIVLIDLQDLESKIAGSLYLIESHLGNMTESSLDNIVSILRKNSKNIPQEYQKLIEMTDQEKAITLKVCSQPKSLNKSLLIPKLILPYIDEYCLKLAELKSSDIESILKIKKSIEIINEKIGHLIEFDKLSFNQAVGGNNHNLILKNAQSCLQSIHSQKEMCLKLLKTFLYE